ncbi:MAG: ATP-binding protein, partial [Proteobacteria bacterium]
MEKRLRRPSLFGTGYGTQFFIRPAADSLAADLRSNADNDEQVSDLTRTLIGFSNTMTPEHTPALINAHFRHHQANGTSEELIGESEFFTPEDFKIADHRIQGRFDELGQFSGSLSIYDLEPISLIVPWSNSRGKMTDCGPFSINFAYVQGLASESTLPPNEWARITRKLKRMGGLYIYRDGIRILPYGNENSDFLDIEKRRSKGAGYYYFSYRRMFGAIEITHSENSNLNEKAGREGFRENRAYRQFKEILINLFVQLAAEFFRRQSPAKINKDQLPRSKRESRQACPAGFYSGKSSHARRARQKRRKKDHRR